MKTKFQLKITSNGNVSSTFRLFWGVKIRPDISEENLSIWYFKGDTSKQILNENVTFSSEIGRKCSLVKKDHRFSK